MCQNEAFNFKNLLPDTIIDGLSACGIRVDSGLMPLNSYENRVWQFSDEDKKRYVVKFYRPQRWSFEQLQEEHQFVAELADSGVPVVSALALEQKRVHYFNGYWFAVFPAMGGREYETDNYDKLEAVARWLGKMHLASGNAQFKYRPTISLTEYFDEPHSPLLQKAL